MLISTTLKFRRITNLNDKAEVMPCWRKGFEFWGTIDPQTGHIVEERFDRIHFANEVVVIG